MPANLKERDRRVGVVAVLVNHENLARLFAHRVPPILSLERRT